MKKRIILPLLFLLAACSEEENAVEFSDSHFLDALISIGVDKDGDGQISREEAHACTSIVLPPSGIEDLGGLEAFINLDSLQTGVNTLGHIDLSANRGLRYLDCSNSSLESLDLTHQENLRVLLCKRNQLEELDLSMLGELTTMKCNNNMLEELNLSANTKLESMTSCGNLLHTLDISMLDKLRLVGIDNMPGLDTVYVWTLPFPPEGVRVLMGFSPNVLFLSPDE